MPVRTTRPNEEWPEVEALLREVAHLDGHDALTEDAMLAIATGAADPGVVATEDGRITGYAHLRVEAPGTVLELAMHPACRATLADPLLQAAVARTGAGPIRLWSFDEETVAAALESGFEERRRILHLVRSLPPDRPARIPGAFEVARFRPERDVGAFLEVNNAAFAGHPDNADWDPGTVAERMQRDWFDPDGLFLARWDGRPVGACWTKLHGGRTGEIYVIAVHPDAQGRSLATGLVLTGLWDLYDRHGATTAILYTEADNIAARRLYDRLGFRVLRTKRMLERN